VDTAGKNGKQEIEDKDHCLGELDYQGTFCLEKVKRSLAVRIFCVFLLAIPVLEISDQFIRYFTGRENTLGIGILLCGWIVTALVVYWIFNACAGYHVAKLALFAFAAKVVYFILEFNHYNLNKDSILAPLFLIVLFEKIELRSALTEMVTKYRYLLLCLLLISLLPFLNISTITGTGLIRTLGVWGNSKCAAYYLFACIVLFSDAGYLVILPLLVLIIFIGARGVIIAGFLYIMFRTFFFNKGRNELRPKFFTIAQLTVLVIVMSGVLYLGLSQTVLRRVGYSFEPLIFEDFRNPQYGHGRVFLNQIVIGEMERFSIWEWVVGRSATDLGDLYEEFIGSRTFPHNDFMNILYTNGVGGLLLYLYYLFVFPLKKLGHGREKSELIALIIAILILGATTGFYIFYASYLLYARYGTLYGETMSFRKRIDEEEGCGRLAF